MILIVKALALEVSSPIITRKKHGQTGTMPGVGNEMTIIPDFESGERVGPATPSMNDGDDSSGDPQGLDVNNVRLREKVNADESMKVAALTRIRSQTLLDGNHGFKNKHTLPSLSKPRTLAQKETSNHNPALPPIDGSIQVEPVTLRDPT